MWFATLRLKNFGRFENKTIELTEGINLIYGGNEVGKSTLHHFIKGMLFGIEKQRGRASKEDAYIKYQPWDTPSIYGGSMDLVVEGRTYRIFRNFLKECRNYKVMDVETGRELPVLDIKGISFIGGLTEENYKNTISIEQRKIRTDKELAEEVRNYIMNLATSKDNQVNVGKALEYLQIKKKQIDSLQTDKKIIELDEKLDQDLNATLQIEQLSFKIKQKEQVLSKEQNPPKKADREKIEEYIQEYAGIREVYRHYMQSKEKCRILKESIVQKPTSQKNMALAAAGAVLGLSGILGILYRKGITWESLSICVWIAVFGGILYFLMRRLGRKKQQGYEDFYEERRELHRGIQEEERHLLEYANRIHDFEVVDDKMMGRLDEEIQALKEGLEERRQKEAKLHESASIEIERYKWELEQFEVKEALFYENKKRHQELKERKRLEEQEKRSIDLALKTIQMISIEIQDGFGQKLNNEASQFLLKQTNWRYEQLKIDEKLNLKILFEDNFISVDQLSIGTIEQVYLALRLAAANMLFPDAMPLLLDDSFAYYDEERLKAVLLALGKEGNRQIIVFTCHKREEAALRDIGLKYNKVML